MHLQVNAAYETGRGQVQGLEGIATQVAEAASRTATGLESQGAATGLNGLSAGGALANDKEPGVPSGYLNYLVYDERYRLVDQGFVQVSEEAAVEVGRKKQHSPEALALDVDIAQNGFLYAYLSNEPSASSSAVHFDDFEVEHQGISIVQHNDYYAFGAVYQQSASRLLSNKYLYQGKELQDGLGLDLYDFHARQYDPLLGRFTSIDPLASSWASVSPYAGMVNNPISYVDPDGRNPLIFIGALATVGAGIGGGIAASKGYGFNDAAFWQHVGIGALGGAAVGTGAWYFAPKSTGLLGGHGGSLSQLFGGAGQTINQAAGGSINLARQVFQEVGPTVGADAALQMLSNNGPPTRELSRIPFQRATNVSQQGLEAIGRHEAFRGNMYNDIADHATIGYGHLVHHGPINGTEPQEFIDGISRERGLELLEQDAQFAVNAVRRYIDVPLTQGQFDALTSFTFNLGPGALQRSTLRRVINAGTGDPSMYQTTITNSFMRYNRARIDGELQPVRGLSRRRADEARMFLYGVY